MRFTNRAARVRYIEYLLTTQPFRHTLKELAKMTGVSKVTVWRDVLLLQTEFPRLAIVRDEEWHLGLIRR